jgi:hypothetical protein
MDPIHPIVPVPPRIPTVFPTPIIGRIDRDSARQQAEQEKRRRRRAAGAALDRPDHLASDTGEDGPGTHVDVTA